jgi:membrane protein implicated in regulation of membrane protease activity
VTAVIGTAAIVLVIFSSAGMLLGWRLYGPGIAALGWALFIVSDVMRGSWLTIPLDAVLMVLDAWLWWREYRKRKDRRRALEAIGDKTRRLRDALVRRAREAARPSPVLRPSLGGAS